MFGLPLATAYATAKGAVLGFTRSLAREPHSTVRVNAVMPMARTRMFEASGGVAGSDEDELVTRYFPADAVAPVIVHLARSDLSLNGQIYEVAGAAVSRITFASGPTIVGGDLDGFDEHWDEVQAGPLTEVDALETSVAAKLAALMAVEPEVR